jgi:uncharacterized protein
MRYRAVVEYVDRAIDPLLRELVATVPAVLLTGARATGKTTTAARLAASVLRLDRPAEAAAVAADPDAALRGLRTPVLIDEWQVVPEVLGAVKRAVDADPSPGRFLVTGSIRGDLDHATWPGTGRLVRLAVAPMTVAEQIGRSEVRWLDRLAAGGELAVPADSPDLRGYVELALRSGFPEAALRVPDAVRHRWLDSYVSQVLTRDAALVDGGRDAGRLQRWFEAYALQTATVVDDRTLYEAAGIDRRTAAAYDALLRNLMIIAPLPSWTSNRLRRIVATPKRMLVDPALVGAALRVDVDGVMRDGTLLGRMVETFVCAQLRVEEEAATTRPRLHHLRTQGGRQEVDLVAELGGGRVVGIEVKASAAPTADAARGLRWLRAQLGDRFVSGVVLHTGPRSFPLGEGIWAHPIASLWATS